MVVPRVSIWTRSIWGREGLRKLLNDWRAGFDQFRFVPREVIDPGGDRFGVLVEQTGMVTHRLSGNVFILRDGLAIRQDIYWDSEQAVEALVTPAH